MDNELILYDRINAIKDTVNRYGMDNFYLMKLSNVRLYGNLYMKNIEELGIDSGGKKNEG